MQAVATRSRATCSRDRRGDAHQIRSGGEMAIWERVKEHWITVTMYLVFSLFFLSACLVSVNTYGAIAQAQRDISLENPVIGADIVPHADVSISFSIQLHNPSRYTLHVFTLSCNAK